MTQNIGTILAREVLKVTPNVVMSGRDALKCQASTCGNRPPRLSLQKEAFNDEFPEISKQEL